jgi:hypothetical protein
MKENEVSVLDQYDIDIKSTRRIRGAILQIRGSLYSGSL